MISNCSPFQRSATTSLRCRDESLPPTQRIASFQVTETPYPRGRGNCPIGRHSPAGSSSANTELCQTLAPPRQGGPSGKLAPPATMRCPPDTPANAPANPCLSGNEGNSFQIGLEAKDFSIAPQPKTKRQSPVVPIVFRIGTVGFLRRGCFMFRFLCTPKGFSEKGKWRGKGAFRKARRRRRRWLVGRL